jgi:hypothetical protein
MEARQQLYERELAYSKAYYAEHKEELGEKRKEGDKVRNAIYRAANIDKVREKDRMYSTAYNAANFEKVNAYKNEHHECACGGHYSNAHKARHNTGKKHMKFMEANP